MEILVFVFKLAVLLLPLVLVGFFGFWKWRKHYGGGTILGYFSRYVIKKRDTDDEFPVYALKVGLFLAWIMFSAPILF